MQINTNGIIIKEQVISENDRLLTILTRESGVIRAFSKGSKSIKSKNFAAVGLFCYSDFTIFKGRDKYIINEASLKECFFKLRQDIEKLALAQYFCELLVNLVQENVHSEQILRLSLNAFYYLSNDLLEKELIKSVFEMRLLAMSGYMPNLISCSKCGVYQKGKMYFSKEAGILICESCLKQQDPSLIELTNSALAALRHSIYADFSKMFSFDVSGESRKILSVTTESYLLNCINKNLKTLDFYKEIMINL